MTFFVGITFATLVALCSVAPTHAHESTLADCLAGSFTCSEECKEVLFCLSDGTQVTVDACDDGWACNASAHACVEGGECSVPPDTDLFVCHDFGYFPNPYECTKYHLCLNNNSITNESFDCPSGTAYDALSTRCSLSLDSRPCREGPVPHCDSPGQVGAVPENPNIFFVCVKEDGVISPQLYKCASDQIFVDNKCVVGRRTLPLENF